MRSDRRTFVAAAYAFLAGAAGAAADGLRRRHDHRARPKILCELPCHRYDKATSSLPALALSQTAVLIRRPATGAANRLAPGVRVAYYQLRQARLAVNHCSISRVALVLRSDGGYSLALRADQNPIQAPPAVDLPAASRFPRGVQRSNEPLLPPAAGPIGLFTQHIKRNEFFVDVRGYTALVEPADLDLVPGRPELFALDFEPFWVERASPLFRRFEGSDARIGDYFAAIDRVEVELSYR